MTSEPKTLTGWAEWWAANGQKMYGPIKLSVEGSHETCWTAAFAAGEAAGAGRERVGMTSRVEAMAKRWAHWPAAELAFRELLSNIDAPDRDPAEGKGE